MDEMSVHFPGDTRVAATYKGFTILTDQPPCQGGVGSAPTPYDLFLASIATCVGQYVLAFCRHRRLSTDGMRIVQRTIRDLHSNMVARVLVEIDLPEDFPVTYREALVRAATLCTVRLQIQSPPAIDIFTRAPGEVSGG